jgi:hypothetical protein
MGVLQAGAGVRLKGMHMQLYRPKSMGCCTARWQHSSW